MHIGTAGWAIPSRSADRLPGNGSHLERYAQVSASTQTFFNTLCKRINVPLVCEPRHPSWGSPKAEAVLAHYAVARVAADPPPWQGADEPGGARELAYFRWHGRPRMYYSDYPPETLLALQEQVARASDRASDIWIIFDNTVLGCALGNAMSLSELIRAEATSEITSVHPG